MAENNQTSMTREERWAEIQKWQVWVNAQRMLLDGDTPQWIENAWGSDKRTSIDAIRDWVSQDVIGEPDTPMIYILWNPREYNDWVVEEFNKLYNKGETQ
jgi:hypothetical protein